ncbi:hypothetical protein DL93DRAFT_2129895 [Clavulina sp. PMI_390]|nr:hypothetical protein DL93DRAFT_2129895 [Clavulina sp. PMI_390]
MFYYISFVRPPTTWAQGTISISIQIANDLRTEICPNEHNVYATWLHLNGTFADAPRKLTTWRPGIENKLLDIPLPLTRRADSAFRLLLSSSNGRAKGATSAPDVISLLDAQFGALPLPVISLPIWIGQDPVLSGSKKGKGGAKPQKQEQIERKLLLPPRPEGTDALGTPAYLTLREETSYDLDKKIWDSGLGLSAWLSRPQSWESNESLRALLTQDSVLSVLELGCGTGLVSLALAALLQVSRAGKETSILATDLASALPLIAHNFEANAPLYTSVSLTAEELDWEDDPTAIKARYPLGHDLIIMADVTYNTDMFPALLRTLEALVSTMTSRGAPSPAVLLAYKERDPGERAIFQLAQAIGVNFVLMDEIEGAGGHPIEIYISKPTLTE